MVFKGTVKWFNDQKGYGFIKPDTDGKDIFLHYTAISMKGFKTLSEGDRISYELEQGPKGQQACKIIKL